MGKTVKVKALVEFDIDLDDYCTEYGEDATPGEVIDHMSDIILDGVAAQPLVRYFTTRGGIVVTARKPRTSRKAA